VTGPRVVRQGQVQQKPESPLTNPRPTSITWRLQANEHLLPHTPHRIRQNQPDGTEAREAEADGDVAAGDDGSGANVDEIQPNQRRDEGKNGHDDEGKAAHRVRK
jgi:hypothetical protein